ncbi:MAG: hypothetical protein HZA61_01460 [Candidatus Eisenbacteria bacterium]|uniref:Integral membrane protein n=1 Tax=Eiseniibacteriota bacterium TaxID=2212470 RepID=A0A933W991_UNCEI|nr:hypothetical protein [Candidatus Eisenbacteria bacterium]
MIRLAHNALEFSFPKVHPDARMSIAFQRTLRIPDDDQVYSLPPGLGQFPLRRVDDFATSVPPSWLKRGGVMLPMYQSEALWISFHSTHPFAVQVGAGMIDAITGEPWQRELRKEAQNYVVLPAQPWLDGFCVRKGVIRQFVAMPLGDGYTAEEQLTGEARFGGLQLRVCPLRPELYENTSELCAEDGRRLLQCCAAMGLAPGGQMNQEIYKDARQLTDWDESRSQRCFVHFTNSLVWRQLTGENPPTVPFTAKEYSDQGLPWFDYYDGDAKALEGAGRLAELESVAQRAGTTGTSPLPENASVVPASVIKLGPNLRPQKVRAPRE